MIYRCLLCCLLLTAAARTLCSEGLKIADTVVVGVPEGWTYVDSRASTIHDLGTLHSAYLNGPLDEQKLVLSVLEVGEPMPGVRYPSALVESTLEPWLSAYRKRRGILHERKLLWKGDYLFYSQKVTPHQGRPIELRGVVFEVDGNWVSYLSLANRTVAWEFYGDLIGRTGKL